VVVMYPAYKLREVRLNLAQRQNTHSQKYDQKLAGHQRAILGLQPDTASSHGHATR
jgi:hypothetical protein